eukprot:scaffold251747_cov27-Prasinocladus_malaysianus.AAC.1
MRKVAWPIQMNHQKNSKYVCVPTPSGSNRHYVPNEVDQATASKLHRIKPARNALCRTWHQTFLAFIAGRCETAKRFDNFCVTIVVALTALRRSHNNVDHCEMVHRFEKSPAWQIDLVDSRRHGEYLTISCQLVASISS